MVACHSNAFRTRSYIHETTVNKATTPCHPAKDVLYLFMCGKVPNASILAMPRRVYPAAAFYTLSRFVGAYARTLSADARPRTPAARLIASRRSASAHRHWTLRRCLGPCRLAEAPFGSSRLPDTKAAPRADTKLHESSAGYLHEHCRTLGLRHKQDTKASQETCTNIAGY